jgi:hypothetical protein
MVPLYENINLRTSDVLGDFSDTFILEHRYGNLKKSKFRLGKISEVLYFVADHPMLSVDTVQQSGQEIKAWRWFTKADKSGITSTYVELAQPPERSDSIITASGQGKLSKKTGLLIENPAEIIEDVVSLNGKSLYFSLFREECERRGIKAAGSLDEIKSLRLYVKNIIESFGGLWVRDNIILYPNDIKYAKKVYSYSEPTFKAKTEDQAGSVKVAFNYNEGSGRYGSFVTFKAVNSAFQNQRVEYCKWLRDNRTAVDLAFRLTEYYAGEHVEVSCEIEGVHSSGEAISLSGAFFEENIFLTEASPKESFTAIKGDMILSKWPLVVLDNYTAELPITQNEGIELEFVNGTLTVTIFDTENKPFVGAFVSLDKGPPKKTNGKGKVQFKTQAGGHVLDIAAPGFDSISNLPITVQ